MIYGDYDALNSDEVISKTEHYFGDFSGKLESNSKKVDLLDHNFYRSVKRIESRLKGCYHMIVAL